MIICSSNGETLESQECLDCALQHAGNSEGAPCGFDYSLVHRLLEGDQGRPEIHVTDLTGCLKKAYLSKTSQECSEPLHMLLPRFLGSAIHEALEKPNTFFRSEVEMDVEGMVGRADILYHNGRLLDIKTTKDIKKNRLPYSSHAMQLNIYRYLLEKAGQPVASLGIQYIGLTGPTTCKEHGVGLEPTPEGLRCPRCGWTMKHAHAGGAVINVEILPEAEIEEEIELRKSALTTALETNFTPMAEVSWLCTYCKFSRGLCPEGTEFASRFRRN